MPSLEPAITTHCVDCNVERYFDKYAVTQGRHLTPRCRACAVRHVCAKDPEQVKARKREYLKEYYKRNKKRLDFQSSDWMANKRLELILELGGICVKCGESDPVVLDFDHIADDGAEHRRSRKQQNVVSLLCRHPEDLYKYQLLCKNCNWRKEILRRRTNAIKEC